MPRPQLKRLQHRAQWNVGHLSYLKYGRVWFHDGHAWGDPPFDDETIADMSLCYFANKEKCQLEPHHVGRRSWGWWEFESPEEWDPSLPSEEQLDRMNLLTAHELHELANGRDAKGLLNEIHGRIFRRPWAWWHFTSPQRRDWDVPELIQLATMPEMLSGRERHILTHKADFEQCQRNMPAWQKRCLYYLFLTDEEREYLGLPEHNLNAE